MSKQKVIDYDSYDNPYISSEITKEIESGYKIIGISNQPYYCYSTMTGKNELFTVTTVVYEKISNKNRKIDTSKTASGIQKVTYLK